MAARLGAPLALLLAIAPACLAQDEARALSRSFRKAAHEVLPAVVTVRGMGGVAPIVPLPGFVAPGVPFPGRDGVPEAGGSGVVIDAAKGYILTNDHVVPDAPRLVVILPDGRQRDVKEVRRDPRSDLALLIVDPEGLDLKQAAWGDSEALELADWVLAVGQPFGLSGTVTAGLVSGSRRGFGPLGYDDLIQTSAAINPGSSGGPLVDLDGKIVGINVAIKTLSGGYEGVGFAVPASRARRVASDLAEHGRVRRAFLGIATEPTPPGAARPGVMVASIAVGSPAAASDLKVGDVILSVGGRPTATPGAVRAAAEFAPTGQPLTVVVRREGRDQDLTIEIKPELIPNEPPAAVDPLRRGPLPGSRRG